jgi:TRAP-type C4-dicarboxylate transport system permease small subunit
LADALRKAGMGVLVVCGAAMSIIVMLQIVFRFVVYVPIPWSEELARYLMIWMGMVGAFVALREGRHIGVSLFVDRLPPRMGARVVFLVRAATILFLLVVARYGIALAVFNASQRSPALDIPMIFPYLAVPVGAVLMIVELTADLLEELYPSGTGARRRLSAATLDG